MMREYSSKWSIWLVCKESLSLGLLSGIKKSTSVYKSTCCLSSHGGHYSIANAQLHVQQNIQYANFSQ